MLRYGCKLCSEQDVRPSRFLARAYQTAIRPKLHWRYGIGGHYGRRVIAILNAQEARDRAAYLLLIGHKFDPAHVAEHTAEPIESLWERAERVRKAISATEHQNFYKDWKLVQQLIDEGIPESEVKEMIKITPNGWFKAKQRGDVRV